MITALLAQPESELTMTGNKEAIPTRPLLPLFHGDPVLLSFEDHSDARLAPVPGFGFAREAIAIPLCVGEFAAAMRHYPIVFAIDDNASPIALIAIRDNLFIERDSSWGEGSYIPAFARRYPFIGAEAPDRTGQLLDIDRASDRFALVTLHGASLQNFQALHDLNAQRANERKALA